MHLILGHPQDACCAGVLARLETRGLPARLIAAPLESPARFVWRLDGDRVTTHFALDDGPPTCIDSVLVRSTGWIDPDGWETADHVYMQSELQATLLAWLAGLHCPVVNRSSAALWYRPLNPLLVWQRLLRRSGLQAPETVLTDDPDTAYAFERSTRSRRRTGGCLHVAHPRCRLARRCGGLDRDRGGAGPNARLPHRATRPGPPGVHRGPGGDLG